MPSKQWPDIPDHPIVHTEVQVDDLLIDPSYQRALSWARVLDVEANFVPSGVGTVIVNRRPDGSLYILDGQHRVAVCKRKGIKTLIAELHDLPADGAGVAAYEAGVYRLHNEGSKNPTPMENYKAGVVARDPSYLAAEGVLQAHNLAMANSGGPNTVAAVNAVMHIVWDFGPTTLERTLTIAEAGWGRCADAWQTTGLNGLAEFLHRHANHFSEDGELGKRLKLDGWDKSDTGYTHVMHRHAAAPSGADGSGSRRTAGYRAIWETWHRHEGTGKGRSISKIGKFLPRTGAGVEDPFLFTPSA